MAALYCLSLRRMNRIKYHIFTILLVLYIALIFYGSLHNFSDTELDLAESFLGIPMDKIVHFAMFFFYPFVSWSFLRFNDEPDTENKPVNCKVFKITRDYYFAVIILTGILLGALTEGSQSWLTTYRQGDVQDLGADILGILTGSAAVFALKGVFIRWEIKILQEKS